MPRHPKGQPLFEFARPEPLKAWQRPDKPKRGRVDFPVPADEPQRCTCGASIVFRGSMPLDLASVLVVGGERRAESHFAHCPDAGIHRRRGKGRRPPCDVGGCSRRAGALGPICSRCLELVDDQVVEDMRRLHRTPRRIQGAQRQVRRERFVELMRRAIAEATARRLQAS